VPDARVQSAIDHWAPRFVQGGVDYNDFVRTTARIERWEDWLDGWRALGDQHAELAREAEASSRRVTAGDAWLRAAVAYHFGRFVWVLDADRAREVADLAVEALYAAHRTLDPTAERIEAPLDGGTVVGNLRRPGLADRPPLVLIIPGLDSTKEEFFTLEEVFLRRGMATLSMDGPGQGECGYDVPIRPDYEVGAAAMLDILDGREDLDLERVGALGVSLGGYHAPRAAAFEPRIRAVAGISGPFSFGALWDRLPELTRETFAAKSGASDDADARRRALELDLDGVLERLDRPALFVTGRHDRLIPPESTERMAQVAPQGSFVVLEDGNHVCANVPYLSRPLVADWLRDRLG
jgi:2,6-dihydroxypseudooxynicotine hydrolase